MPKIADPTPAWLKPENRSVFDSYWKQVLQAIGPYVGADDPVGTVMGMGAAMEVPETALRHLAPDAMQMLVDFARRGKTPLKTLQEPLLAGQAYANLADTLVPGAAKGDYVLKPEVIERLRDLHKLGEGLADQSVWAGAQHEDLVKAFDGDRDAALMFSRMFAATSPNTSDLSKQIDQLQWVDWPAAGKDHGILVAFKDGERVIHEQIPRSKLADYIGKEPAEKLLAQKADPRTAGARELSGVDLQVGGEGMRHFYDAVLPKRLEKIVKPFGGTVENVPLNADKTAKLAAQNEMYYEQGRISEAEYLKRKSEMEKTITAWVARLTPEMKARILKEGLPLLSLLPLGVLGNYGQQPAEPAR